MGSTGNHDNAVADGIVYGLHLDQPCDGGIVLARLAVIPVAMVSDSQHCLFYPAVHSKPLLYVGCFFRYDQEQHDAPAAYHYGNDLVDNLPQIKQPTPLRDRSRIG